MSKTSSTFIVGNSFVKICERGILISQGDAVSRAITKIPRDNIVAVKLSKGRITVSYEYLNNIRYECLYQPNEPTKLMNKIEGLMVASEYEWTEPINKSAYIHNPKSTEKD